MIFANPTPLLQENLRDDLTLPQLWLDSEHPLRSPLETRRTWLVDDTTGREYGRDELKARTLGLANSLSSLYGIKEDDVVVLFSPNDVDYPVVLWAIHRLGAIAACANSSYSSEELEYLLGQVKPSLIIAHEQSLHVALEAAKHSGLLSSDRVAIIQPPIVLAAAPPSLDFDTGVLTVQWLIDAGLNKIKENGRPAFTERRLNKGEAKTKIAFLCFSSGTTGRPKAVALSHYNVTSNIIQTATCFRLNDHSVPVDERSIRQSDVGICVLPLFHVYGLMHVLHGSIFFGIKLVIVPKYTFPTFLQSVAKYRVSLLWLVPPMAVSLAKDPEVKNHDLSSVRYILAGAAPVSETIERALKQIIPGANVGQGYGASEAPSIIAIHPLRPSFKARPGAAGQLIPGWEAKIVKDDGSLACHDEAGELYLRGPAVVLGYYGNPEATAETFIDGWVRTGDLITLDQQCNIFIHDRVKEFLKVRGNQVAPAELEGHLLGHPAVADACVVSLLDEYSGELPLAYIVLRPTVAPSDEVRESITKHVSDHKIRYKWLAGGVIFTDVIPKTASGKILRRVLRDQARAEQARQASVEVIKPKL